MTAKFSQLLLAIGLMIGLLFVLNGLVHLVIYMFDSQPVFSGLRYINHSTLLVGLLISLPIIHHLNKKEDEVEVCA